MFLLQVLVCGCEIFKTWIGFGITVGDGLGGEVNCDMGPVGVADVDRDEEELEVENGTRGGPSTPSSDAGVVQPMAERSVRVVNVK